MRPLVLLFLLSLLPHAQSEPVIHHAATASETTQWAAKELQRLLVAAGCESSPAIRLVADDSLPHDGFEIRSEKGGIIIAGNDSMPEGTWALPSHGTLWGVLDFAERFIGARWLFPGPLGEDVPRLKILGIELKEPIRGQPGLAARSVAYLGESDREITSRYVPVLDWMKHQRLTNALHPFVTGYGHSWDDYLKPADIEAHPEWQPSSGNFERNGKVTFFCTTAPGLVELFTKRVIETMDRNPKREMSSISPTDGGGFCTCERCKPLLDTDPHGKPSHARAMLTFYQRVGEIIARERPGRRLGGFVYYNYQYPPANAPKLPDNVSLCWAPLNYYGYGLLKPLYRAEFEGLMKRWSEITPHLFYHNYSTWMRSLHGAPLPVSLDILKRELPAAAQNKAWGARMVGTSAWGVNAPINYLLAKQLWNPQLDVSATLNEWLERAYGPGWRHMRALYDELDAKMATHKAAQSPIYKGANYEVNEEVMRTIYAPLFATMEQHYHATLAECATEVQRQRLAMFGHNLTQLHFALRKAGLIPDDDQSLFRRDDAAFAQFLKDMETTFSLYRDKRGLDHGPIWKGEWREP
ncbi:MAG: DUF4838 domain-containing protein [Prosthecobacter sp.]|uniref:DUF4838 domain-containing protein n=1 Tax=Prosthecobacter sp. TaxID=1965333 RepID=UPI0038FF7DA5